MTARVGVITFPGSLDDRDAARAVPRAGAEAVPLWHAETRLGGVDAVILPGGFSYGDYLRCGAIARFAPVMAELVPAARAGLPVLGICNGFQILCEAHLLPGALTRNGGLRFITAGCGCDEPPRPRGPVTTQRRGDHAVLKSGEGAYVARGRCWPGWRHGGRWWPLLRRQPERLGGRHRRGQPTRQETWSG